MSRGECLTQIARFYGFPDHHAIYDHPENAELKRRRPDPNILFPGDSLFIPDLNPKEVTVATGASHRFEARMGWRKLHLALRDAEGAAIRDAPFTLTLGGETRTGRTGGDGILDEEIPTDLASASLEVAGVRFALDIGHLNPLAETGDDVSGVQVRLKNLGYQPGAIDGQLGPRTQAAIRAFQRANGLAPDGACSAALADKLRTVYGC